ESDWALTRILARVWVWLCPGTGYAGIGRPGLAVTSFFLWLAFTPLFAWFIYTLEPVAGWAFAAVGIFATILWVVEVVATWLPTSRPPAPRVLARFPIFPILVMWMMALAWSALLLLNVHSFVMAGNGMAPTLPAGEQG